MMTGWGAGDRHAPKTGRTFGWENILGWSPGEVGKGGKDGKERQTKKCKPTKDLTDTDNVCEMQQKEIIYWLCLEARQTRKWGPGGTERMMIGSRLWGVNNYLSLGYSSLKSRVFLVVQSRTLSSFATISFPCQRPCHNFQSGTNEY